MPLAVATPQQKISLSPHSGQIFEFNTADSKLYLARNVNDLLTLFGNNVVIDGMNPAQNLTITTNANGNKVLSTTVSPGLAIVDKTLLEDNSITPTTVSLTVGPTTNLSNAKVLVFVNFQYIDAFVDNRFAYKLIVTDANYVIDNTLNQFEPNKDNLLLGVYDFNAAGTAANLRIVNSYNPFFYSNAQLSSVTITDPSNNATYTYQIYPPSTIVKLIGKAIAAVL